METASAIPVSEPVKLASPNFKWKPKYFFIVGGVGIAAYAVIRLANQAALLSKTCFKPSGFVPTTLTLNDADINIKLDFKNKSNIEYYLKNQAYNVYINDQFVGSIANPNRIPIAPATDTSATISPVWLNLKFNPAQVLNISWTSLLGLITNGGDVKVQIKGIAKVIGKSGLFRYNYPVDSVFTLKELTSGAATAPC